VKKESRDMEEEGACGWSEEIARRSYKGGEESPQMARDVDMSPSLPFSTISLGNVHSKKWNCHVVQIV